MKILILFLVLIISASGCVNEPSKFYASYADAVADEAISKGWVPDFLPRNSTNIYERHSVDTGGVAVIFSSPEVNFLKGFSKVDRSYADAAKKEFSLVRPPANYHSDGGGYYYRCSGEGLGLLEGNGKNLFYYIEPVSSGVLLGLCKESHE